uniref:Diadenosine tetraphosphate (Ap4A) hydrolase n=1 Tax=Candidatus Kentrum sp. MB TaxID=2138164 RepID=A0A451BA37_9GAMM|nr:MAG: Diadenosine tetraphosphate (Ap4A) hydrolase [Candidatus Kentron sp. MB]VFK75127.1 MAG: Diadenosine tetraphosphate (Ap4A) hydrolase [Candidatus Kentron sp. MB]
MTITGEIPSRLADDNAGFSNIKKSIPCSFCNGFPGLEHLVGMPIDDITILRTENFIVIPDIAPLLEGHILIVTTKHYPCFGAMPPEHLSESIAIKRQVKRMLTSAYCAPIFFEHGPATCDGLAGACVDHAHLHCLPVEREFFSLIAPGHNSEQISSIAQLAEYTKNGFSYLFYESLEESLRVYPLKAETDDIPSQHLRCAAARIFSISKWNWRDIIESPDYEKVMRPRILKAVDLLRCTVTE